MSKLERVARAVWEVRRNNSSMFPSWDELEQNPGTAAYDAVRAESLDIARAVLRELREPDKQSLDAMDDAWRWTGSHCAAWLAGIDAILGGE